MHLKEQTFLNWNINITDLLDLWPLNLLDLNLHCVIFFYFFLWNPCNIKWWWIEIGGQMQKVQSKGLALKQTWALALFLLSDVFVLSKHVFHRLTTILICRIAGWWCVDQLMVTWTESHTRFLPLGLWSRSSEERFHQRMLLFSVFDKLVKTWWPAHVPEQQSGVWVNHS